MIEGGVLVPITHMCLCFDYALCKFLCCAMFIMSQFLTFIAMDTRRLSCEYAGLLEVRRSGTMAKDSQNTPIDDRTCFECDTALEARKRQRTISSGSCFVALINTHFEEILFVRCELWLFFFRGL